ncbi:hypothetical protein CN681_12895 [Bacillus toyonensis]|uniref:hypothetical protein n=1 Tax=Bacillus cereus group TaxID=86661 RepID=UPI000BF14B04|nr:MULTISPECIES: hypothetical protein [Bacillus cereus group]MDA2407151.1 hypothetical protein [Bacillus cereus]PEK09861.1 hypothetical protein CN681_12895 [Bacillus toyonensis]PGA03896.1 hypothetical protein COL67_23075 [Bacillus toyonensis]PGV39150.1 hypothetical protein COD74_26695 [Bacillus cereus]
MRVKIKLSRHTVIAFQEFKKLLYGDPDMKVTNGYVLGAAFKSLESSLSSINWEEIDKSPIPNVTDNNDKSIVGVDTTLNIESSILKGIEKLQKDFLNIFKAKRIHKSYVVKLIMYAAILQHYSNTNLK